MSERHTQQTDAPVCIGIGVASGFGFGKASLVAGLRGARSLFAPLARQGRTAVGIEPAFGVELPDDIPAVLRRRDARTTGLTGTVSVAVVAEAWKEAGLDKVDPMRIGLVVGGSNLQSREHYLTQQKYVGDRLLYLPPRQGHQFFDSDISALCTSFFGIRGFTHTVGGASASGALAVHHAVDAVRLGRVDACIALGSLQDISIMELQGLRALGAMGPTRSGALADVVCRPFDCDRDGFLFGESAAALVIARGDGVTQGYGRIAGTAQVCDGERGPSPSLDGEARVIRLALEAAGYGADQIDLVGAHGTGTPQGDDTEAEVLASLGLHRAQITAPKSVLGHGLSSAGATEIAIAFLQMQAGEAWPIRNLDHPIRSDLGFVRGGVQQADMRTALTLSFGFGGINTATVLSSAAGVRS